MLKASYAVKLLATRRVMQINKGKNTPGVDGKTVLTPEDPKQLTKSIS
ncbi:MAG: reverse transcriptase N-terminal domain-containing protein [Mangrovibacterium sp.]